MLKAFWKKIDILKKNNVPIRQVSNFNYCNIFLKWSVWKKLSIEIQDLTIIHILVLVNMFELYSISAEKSDYFFNTDTLITLYTVG